VACRNWQRCVTAKQEHACGSSGWWHHGLLPASGARHLLLPMLLASSLAQLRRFFARRSASSWLQCWLWRCGRWKEWYANEKKFHKLVCCMSSSRMNRRCRRNDAIVNSIIRSRSVTFHGELCDIIAVLNLLCVSSFVCSFCCSLVLLLFLCLHTECMTYRSKFN